MWAVWVSLAAAAVSLIVAPLLAVADYALNGNFYPAKFFFAITLTGIGLFLLPGVRYLLNLLVRGTVRYWKWNQQAMREITAIDKNGRSHVDSYRMPPFKTQPSQPPQALPNPFPVV
ncbi:hypothetical protein [Paenibacillus sp. NRS-1781]|uniref:hypothetical protein n=1 Tax=Paenibacillus sp. NRS-1781 TaxID=3233905 RepID=UPI003D26EA9A